MNESTVNMLYDKFQDQIQQLNKEEEKEAMRQREIKEEKKRKEMSKQVKKPEHIQSSLDEFLTLTKSETRMSPYQEKVPNSPSIEENKSNDFNASNGSTEKVLRSQKSQAKSERVRV